MNADKLKKLQAQVRIGGKGTPRRKKKIVHATAATDDKKLQSTLKKLSVNAIPGIEEVNMIKDDGTVLHFKNPKTQASLAANTFAITGHGENKQVRFVTRMLSFIVHRKYRPCAEEEEEDDEKSKQEEEKSESIHGNFSLEILFSERGLPATIFSSSSLKVVFVCIPLDSMSVSFRWRNFCREFCLSWALMDWTSWRRSPIMSSLAIHSWTMPLWTTKRR